MVAVLLLALSPAASLAAARQPGSPPTKETQVACFRPESNQYAGKVEPPNCELWGRLLRAEFASGKELESVDRGRFYRAGFIEIEWFRGWGNARARSLASLKGSGRGVTIDAYGRVRCADGSYWYSKVNVFKDTHILYEVRLPVCGRPLSSLALSPRR